MESNIKKQYMHTCKTESLCCTTEISRTLYINHTSVKMYIYIERENENIS